MRLQLFSRISARQWRVYSGLTTLQRQCPATRSFSSSARALAIKPFLLADIGEGRDFLRDIMNRFLTVA